MDDVDFENHLAQLKKSEVLGEDWNTMVKPNLPAIKNYTDGLIQGYIDKLKDKHKVIASQEKVQTNLLRRFVLLEEVENMIIAQQEEATHII